MLRAFFHSFYWKLSAIFLVLLTLVGSAYIALTLTQSEMYFAETSQRLNASLAEHIVNEIQVFVDNKPNFAAMDGIFHDVMVVNPSVEVYLLDPQGTILTYDAPADKVRLTNVSLGPIEEFIESGGRRFVLGDNPRDPAKPRVFSAAAVRMNGMVYGYIYVILRGEQYDSAADRLSESHFLQLGAWGIALSLAGAAAIGLVALAFVTRKLRRIAKSVEAFTNGDLTARVPVTSRDELDRLGAAFNQMADTINGNLVELKNADMLRRELIANVSHDLRTPLASMQGYIETVLMKNDSLQPDERRQYLKTILSSSERLTNLVHELFELSKLEAKQTRPNPEPFSLPELANDVTQKFVPQAGRKHITVAMHAQSGLPLVRADIGLIERVLQNLIDNAVNYTLEGGSVEVNVHQVDGKVRTDVKDTGVGIDEKDLPFIFDRFYQARSRVTTAGAGLGLAIARKIIEAHGESIAVTSRVNMGTIFSFELPVAGGV